MASGFCLLYKHFFLSHYVNAFWQVACSLGGFDVTLEQYAVYGVDVYRRVSTVGDFNFAYVVDNAVNAYYFVGRAAEILYFRRVDISAAAGDEHWRVAANVEHGVVEVQTCFVAYVHALQCAGQAVVVGGASVGYGVCFGSRKCKLERLVAVFIGFAGGDEDERLACLELVLGCEQQVVATVRRPRGLPRFPRRLRRRSQYLSCTREWSSRLS